MVPYKTLTAEDYLQFSDMTALYGRQCSIAQLFREQLDRTVTLSPPDVSRGLDTPAFPAFINVFEENLRRLYTGFRAAEIEPSREWLGEERDRPYLSHNDANRWFDTLSRLAEMIVQIAHKTPVCNRCRAGADCTVYTG